MKTSVYIYPGKHFNFAFPFRIFLLIILLSCFYISPAPAQLSRFAQRSIPNGIEVDASGNVHLGHDAVSSKIIAKFSPGGRLLNQVAVGNFFSFGQDVRMARIPSTGGILGIFPNGDFVIMDPRTNRLSMLGNLKQLNIRTDRIFDVYTGKYSRIAGNVIPSASQTLYGDIAVHESGRNLSVFVTGVTLRFPFVVRIRFVDYQYRGAEVVVASLAADFSTSESPRGIAVNKYGAVLTSLPTKRTPTAPGYDAGVKFRYNFGNGSNEKPAYIFGGRDLPSQGMAADENGNFYVAVGPVGSSLAGAGSGPVIALNASLNRVLWRATFGGVLVNSQDVAINPDATRAYFTISNFNTVFQVDLTRLPSRLEKADTSAGDAVQLTAVPLEPTSLVVGEKARMKAAGKTDIPESTVAAYHSGQPLALPQPGNPANGSINRRASNEIETHISVYPNPASEWVQVEVGADAAGDYQLSLTDASGRIVWRRDFPVEEPGLDTRIDLRTLPAGLYHLSVISGGKQESRTLVKQ